MTRAKVIRSETVSTDSETKVNVNMPLGYTGGTSLQRSIAKCMAMKITESGSYTYIAVAAPGTEQSDPKWQVKRLDETVSGTIVITWADGDADFDNVATDLTGLTYS